MKKLLSLLSVTLLTSSTISILNIQENTKSLKYNVQAIDLDTVITTTDLGTIYIGQLDIPTETMIKDALKFDDINPDLDVTKIVISSITNESATVTPSDATYSGEVILSYQENNFNQVSTEGVLPSAIITSLTTDSNQTIYAGINSFGLYTKTTEQEEFTETTALSEQFTTCLTTGNDGTVYLGSSDQVVYKTTDGENFSAITDIEGWIYAVIVASDNTIYAGSGDGNVYKSTDGESFTALSGTSTSIIYSLTIGTDGTIYAGSRNGKVYKSTDQENFTQMTGTSGFIYSLTTGSDGAIYAGSSNGNIYKSTGSSFSSIIDIDEPIRSLTTTSGGDIYAGSLSGNVYKSTDDGSSFTITTGTIGEIDALTIDNEGTIYAGGIDSTTNNTSLYKSTE